MAKLSYIVGLFLDLENYGDDEYARAYRFAMRGVQTEIQTDIEGNICKHTISIGKDRTACLPDACMKVTHVDYDYSYGMSNECSNMDDSQFDNYIKNFKVPYEIDYKKRKITFPADYEYDSVELTTLDRGELCGDTSVNDMLVNMLVSYIKWQWEMGRKGNNVGTINFYKMEYYREKANAKFRIGRPTNQELNRDARIHDFYGIKA